jgi:outer membrane protein OmpA-like peptidoglycan-associated protein
MLRFLTAILVLGSLAIGCTRTTPSHPSASLSDRDLANALAHQGVGQLTDKPAAPPSAGETTPTEIRQTPRGVVVTFPEVLFSFDSAELTPRARREIERMAIVLSRPQVSGRLIAIEGHADAIGTDAYNLELSRRRADAVALELLARGIRRDRLTVEAFGKRKPVAANVLPDGRDNPAGRALNRRVEAVVQTAGVSTR